MTYRKRLEMKATDFDLTRGWDSNTGLTDGFGAVAAANAHMGDLPEVLEKLDKLIDSFPHTGTCRGEHTCNGCQIRTEALGLLQAWRDGR